ncbi:MAG: S-methyl-5-thioribose-1-phosphate isomerase [Gammaproteobacteria bacterium]|nr:S-methyl-5-thioribose-1-phosphate isomerase [Gammaproteobacteria bacterium]
MEALKLKIVADADHAVVWQNDRLYLLDQRLLPEQERYVELQSCSETTAAIRSMVVRGAPAIGITAAYAVVLAARTGFSRSPAEWRRLMQPDVAALGMSRPTAVNLRWAIERMLCVAGNLPDGDDPEAALLAAAIQIHQEDVEANRRIGAIGAGLIRKQTSVITHCNAGALATGGYGTALGVIRSAFSEGLIDLVYADETRPWFQGSRLTAWELSRDGIPVRIMTEGAAARRMSQGGIGWVIVGSDRIAANGDVVNKIGTYNLAVVARYHGVRVMVAAPTSTIDMSVSGGTDIPIEMRDPEEVLSCGERRIGAPGVDAWNPVFDVTPAALVDVIVTERGAVHRPDAKKIADLMKI